MAETNIIRPQQGYQMMALSSQADIVIGGGSAGVGKTFTLLIEFLRHINNKDWGGVIFRRTTPQIRNEGGLWDTSIKLYPYAGGDPKESSLEWYFRSGAKIKFSHLEYEKDVLNWQGSQIAFIGFDELTHFTETMFFYLLSRNRSTCGIKPYVRATCNPDPDSWVYKLIEWWVDPETGFPIKERNGVVRYFARDGRTYIWGDTLEEVVEKAWYFLEAAVEKSGIDPREFVKSITYISGSIYENKKLLEVNPAYLANLMAQDEQTRLQLLDGNWKVVISDNDIYNYASFVGLFENVYSTAGPDCYITADIALMGSDKFVVGFWRGFELCDITIIGKSDGPEVIKAIKEMAMKYKVPNHNIVYDNDGVGGFVGGFIPGSQPFVNNGSPIADPETLLKENYQNLKTQCYYKSGRRVNEGGYKIAETVACKMYDDKNTVRQQFMQERKAIKRDKMDMDGKLAIIPKEKMKVLNGGKSPDLMDMFMMREYFELAFKFEPVAL